MDTRGPNDTAKWLGVERDAMAKLNSTDRYHLAATFCSERRANLPPDSRFMK